MFLHWGYPGHSTLLGLPGKAGSNAQCHRDTCWGHLPLSGWHIWVNKRQGQGEALLGTQCPSARPCCVTLSRAAPENPHSHRQPQVLSMNYIAFPIYKEDQKHPVVLQGNINVVFGLWCSRARLPITGGSIVQTRIPCWLIGKNTYTAK